MGQPIVQFIENVFVGSSDDLIDLDGTDAWVEGNLFLHVHKNGSPDSARTPALVRSPSALRTLSLRSRLISESSASSRA